MNDHPSAIGNGAKGDPPKSRLLTLEAGRFFAAAAVMLYHYSRQIGSADAALLANVFSALRMGVPYFFVLSGFVIYHVHRKDIGQPRNFGRFVRKRAVRLLPMFWAISLAMLAGFVLVAGLSGERTISPVGALLDLLLLPHGDAILAISWTLRHEVVFYAMFALAILFGARMLWLVVIWAAISLAMPSVPPEELGSWSIVASSYNLGFVLGLACGMLLAHQAPFRPGLFALLGAAIMAGVFVADWTMMVAPKDDPLGLFGSIGHLVAAALLIYGLVGLEQRWKMPGTAIWKALGGCSYILYLIHQPLASVLERLLRRFADVSGEAAFVILAACALAAALVVHLIVERPLLAWLGAWADRPSFVFGRTADGPG